MKIAILGGSFNPVHIGHLVLAEDVCISLGYDKVLFVPVFHPPHKEMNDAENGADRFAMVKLACASDLHFEAERCELDRGGISYTYDTVCFLEKKYHDTLEGKIGLIMGADLTSEFEKWYKADKLSDKAAIILARRPYSDYGGELESFVNKPVGAYTGLHPSGAEPAEFGYPCTVLENPVLSISSTEIRARIAQGRGWRYLVPEPVYHYIIQRKLYGYKE